MAIAQGIDYAWGRPNYDELVRQGFKFVCRYLAYLPNGKVLLSDERRILHSKGLSIVLNWEQAAGDMFKGYATGAQHAREALRQANSLGAPATAVIYFSCDKDVTTTAQMNAVRDYLNGAASVLGYNRVGVYGEYSVIENMVGSACAWGWQTYAWSGGKISGKAHFRQYKNGVNIAGVDSDRNEQLKAQMGAWLPTGQTDVGTIQQEEMMSTAAEDAIARIDSRVTTMMYGLTANAWGAGSMLNETNKLQQDINTLLAAATADAARDTAMQTAINAIATAISSAGGEVDIAPVIAAVNGVRAEVLGAVQASQAETDARVAALHADLLAAQEENHSLQDRLATALRPSSQG